MRLSLCVCVCLSTRLCDVIECAKHHLLESECVLFWQRFQSARTRLEQMGERRTHKNLAQNANFTIVSILQVNVNKSQENWSGCAFGYGVLFICILIAKARDGMFNACIFTHMHSQSMWVWRWRNYAYACNRSANRMFHSIPLHPSISS